MQTAESPLSLRTVLIADTALCAAMGAVLTTASGLVAGLTAIPETLLFFAGLVLIPTAAFIAVVASRPYVAILGWLVVAGNLAWAGASIALPISGLIVPNAFGWAFVAAQAAAVALLAWLEYAALRGGRPGLVNG